MPPEQRDANLIRRDFLSTVAWGSAAALMADPSANAAERSLDLPHKEVDVAIIGAGLAGLTAAHELRKQGATVVVLEARDRVGGRTLDKPIRGHVVEGGGQWVGPSQTQVQALAKELGIATYPSYAKGKTVLRFGGLRFTRKPDEENSAEVKRVIALLEAMAQAVPLESPWNAPHARVWDARTVADWLADTTKDRATRQELDLDIETTLGPPSRLSLLYFLFYLRSAGGMRALNVDAQERRLVGGPQAISKKLAEHLGHDLVLSSPVSRVVHGNGKRVAVESKRLRIAARHVVVAMMPADNRRIEFTPELPAARRGLMKAWRGEPAFKVNVIFPTPFWRADGLSGLGLTDRGPVGITFDNSPPDGSFGVLLGFLTHERVPKDAQERRRAVLESLSLLFGEKAKTPIDYVETDWSTDSWSSGCVSALPPNVLTQYGRALREPVGAIHWAGTETSLVWCGYMDGAVRSGQRVASEILKVLR